MNIKKDKTLLITLISAILFTIFFLITLTFYYDVILLEVSLKSFSREYYNWWMGTYELPGNIINISLLIKIFFDLILLLEFLYIAFNEKYKAHIDKKNLILSIIIGTAINFIINMIIIYNAEHYRLFMELISTQVGAIVLLNLVLNINKRLNNNM